jgi:hypothetical protein
VLFEEILMGALAAWGIGLALGEMAHEVRVGQENKKKLKEDESDEERRRLKAEADEKRKAMLAERGQATGGYQSTLGAGAQSLGG